MPSLKSVVALKCFEALSTEVASTPRGRELTLARNLEAVLSFVIMVSKEGELLVKILMFLSILGSTQGQISFPSVDCTFFFVFPHLGRIRWFFDGESLLDFQCIGWPELFAC